MKHLPIQEQRVIGAMTRAILADKTCRISVCDDHSLVQPESRNRAMIEASIGHTPETRLVVRRTFGVGSRAYAGEITLTHGKGEQVVTEYTYDLASLIEEAQALAEKMKEV
ncbi:hypothetical protein [uncultured Roseobacter sp.]|uniref:hypothetical protein n=1 Tax=uncultured Roseobacter sp. TaxID=114847 RepID=UPI00260F5E80|nr:hypothetical protein [uncultured Roseobacter sp.]